MHPRGPLHRAPSLRGARVRIPRARSFQYEEAVKRDPYLYDAWFDFVKLEEEALGEYEPDEAADESALARVREAYERAIANVPPAPDKRLWRRYAPP